jgi:hypothetical protein
MSRSGRCRKYIERFIISHYDDMVVADALTQCVHRQRASAAASGTLTHVTIDFRAVQFSFHFVRHSRIPGNATRYSWKT